MAEKNNLHYLHLEKFSPFHFYYAYLDVPEYLADRLFIQHQVRVRFGCEYRKDGERYVVVLCRVRKKDAERFLEAIDDLPRKMLLLGYTDYLECCSKLKEQLNMQRQAMRSA